MRFPLWQRRCRNRLVALVDPASEQRERDLVTFAEPRDDPSGLVHPVPHLRYEFLCAREEQRPRQLDPTETSGPSPPRKTKIFFPTLATWSPGQGSSVQASGCFSA